MPDLSRTKVQNEDNDSFDRCSLESLSYYLILYPNQILLNLCIMEEYWNSSEFLSMDFQKDITFPYRWCEFGDLYDGLSRIRSEYQFHIRKQVALSPSSSTLHITLQKTGHFYFPYSLLSLTWFYEDFNQTTILRFHLCTYFQLDHSLHIHTTELSRATAIKHQLRQADPKMWI